ncbi:DDRGK domain containing protein [Trypanosoma melophagium]|uniref:DDRGK domain containing protein n=1 Tax=Trypanosoma melophagium TaxID=715481 RepID=UPI00351A8566|nr:DDRGK domain containing protein [Trypanosoma melophagium]
MLSIILGTLLLFFLLFFGAVYLRRKPAAVSIPTAAAARAVCHSGARESDGDTEEDREREREEEEGEEREGRGVRPSRLLRRRKEREREREERRRAVEAQQEAQRQRQQTQREREEEREREAGERREAEKKALEELREERRRREDEEFAKWAGAIGVEERGELGDEERTRREALVAFLTARGRELEERQQEQQGSGKHVVAAAAFTSAIAQSEDDKGARNILVLGDVAREHGVTVDVVVQLIEKLLEDGVISGVFDDRGKFVIVTEAHFVKIAEFIQQRGRVSVRELVRECNKVILS